jgi:hypothetical protein
LQTRDILRITFVGRKRNIKEIKSKCIPKLGVVVMLNKKEKQKRETNGMINKRKSIKRDKKGQKKKTFLLYLEEREFLCDGPSQPDKENLISNNQQNIRDVKSKAKNSNFISKYGKVDGLCLGFEL